MIEYHIALNSVSLQILRVTINIPALTDTVELALPAWIPGSYMIRDFARNLGEFSAYDNKGNALLWQKVDKQTWQVTANSAPCTINYVVVANDYSVRGAYLNDEYAFFNATSVFLSVLQAAKGPHSVVVDTSSAPESWQVYSSLPEVCDDYATLIDHPVYWGEAQTAQFRTHNVDFTLLFSGNQPLDVQRISDDLVPICQHHLTLFGEPAPVTSYLFITLLADKGYGGLEHKHSTVLMYPRFDLPLLGENAEGNKEKSDSYIDFLSLCSHEFFHTWHVKRIRPKALLEPDLQREVYTPQLWIYEGFTSFYDDLAVARAGIMTPEHYCTILGRHLTRLMHTPGRKKQTVAESSFDAWTRFYKQDAHSNNHIVSYYTKGGIIAMGLDILLRQGSQNEVSLDSVMQLLWKEHGADESGTIDEQIELACKHLGVDVSDYLNAVVHGTDDVALTALLPHIGLQLHTRAREQSSDKGGTSPGRSILHDCGLTISEKGEMGCKITQIIEGGAGEKAGLQINDRVIAVSGWIATESLWLKLLNQSSEQAPLVLTVARQGRLLTLSMPIIERIERTVYITIEDRQKYLAWLGIAPD